MTQSEISKDFAKFAKKTTKGNFDEKRKGERIDRGIPFPVGTTGTAVVSKIVCSTTKPNDDGEKFPMIRVELTAQTPEGARGKTLSGPGLMQVIKDGRNPDKWSAADAFGAALGILEDLGLPKEISTGYEEFDECIAWFEDEERKVQWEVVDASYTTNGRHVNQKGIQAVALVDEGKMESAVGDSSPEEDPDAKYCTYNGVRHKILSEDEGMLELENMNSGRVRKNIDKDDVTME